MQKRGEYLMCFVILYQISATEILAGVSLSMKANKTLSVWQWKKKKNSDAAASSLYLAVNHSMCMYVCAAQSQVIIGK